MGRATEIDNDDAAGMQGESRVFGVPVGRLGWFASLLIGTAIGAMMFFAGTFLGIVGILIYNSVAHGSVDFADSYKFVGLPLGTVAGVVALGYLGGVWVKGKLRKA
jgi:hypothetical protein